MAMCMDIRGLKWIRAEFGEDENGEAPSGALAEIARVEALLGAFGDFPDPAEVRRILVEMGNYLRAGTAEVRLPVLRGYVEALLEAAGA